MLNFKKLGLLIGVLLLLPFSSSFAETYDGVQLMSEPLVHALYVRLSGGVIRPATDTDNNSTSGGRVKTTYKSGWNGSSAFGYQFNNYLRAEVESMYTYSPVSKVSFTGFNEEMNGYAKGWIFFVNGYFDLHNSSDFTPFIGVGAGYASIKAFNERKATPEYPGYLKLNDPAVQGIVGLNYAISDSWLVGADAHLVYVKNDKAEEFSSGVTYKNIDFLRTLINLSVTYRFDF